MRLSRLLPSLLLATLLATSLAACGQSEAKATLPATAEGGARLGVRVISPSTSVDGQLVRAMGSLKPRNEAQVSAKAGGTIQEFFADVGDDVKKGAPLARLDPANAAIMVEQAKAGLAVAEASLQSVRQDYERAKKLVESGGISQAGLDRAEAGYQQAEAGAKQAQAALQAAQRAYADHTIRAPFDGRITARLANLGEYVSVMPATPIFSLVDLNNLEVVLPVPETVVGAVRHGATVRGVVNPSGKAFEAEVTVVGAAVNPQSRTVEVRAKLVGDRSDEMRPHAIVEVDFSSQAEVGSGLFLPTQAVIREGDARFVWVVDAASKVMRRQVQAEALTPGVVRVTSGLEGSEQVVQDGSSNLQDGMQVQVIR